MYVRLQWYWLDLPLARYTNVAGIGELLGVVLLFTDTAVWALWPICRSTQFPPKTSIPYFSRGRRPCRLQKHLRFHYRLHLHLRTKHCLIKSEPEQTSPRVTLKSRNSIAHKYIIKRHTVFLWTSKRQRLNRKLTPDKMSCRSYTHTMIEENRYFLQIYSGADGSQSCRYQPAHPESKQPM